MTYAQVLANTRFRSNIILANIIRANIIRPYRIKIIHPFSSELMHQGTEETRGSVPQHSHQITAITGAAHGMTGGGG